MKKYPSIPTITKASNLHCIFFEKNDGSNLRSEWQRKTGWCKFGSRHLLFDKSHPEFGCAIKLFQDNFFAMEKFFCDKKYEKATIFCEFFGPNSFAGQHDVSYLNSVGFNIEDNEPKQLVLFDVEIHKKGFMSPREFVDNFGDLQIAKVISEGILDQKFIEDVKEGKYPVFEGVVAKSGIGHNLWRGKIKTNAYLKKLKEIFKNNYEKYV